MNNMAPKQIAVVLFPNPEELKRRSENRFKDMGKEVPADAVNEMIGTLLMFMLVFRLNGYLVAFSNF